MATETNNSQATNNAENNNDGKIIFTEAQQDKVNQLIREAQGRAARELRTELDQTKSQLQQLQSDLDAARNTAKDPTKSSAERKEAKGEVEELQRQIDEMKSASQTTLRQVDTLTKQLQAKDQEVQKEREKALAVQKTVAITSAAQEAAEFVNLDVVKTLTEKFFKWDDAEQKFVVINEHGQPRMNAAFEQMSPKEFMQDFAEKNPYLVRSSAKTGTGSSESTRSNLGNLNRYSVEQVFGKQSSAKLANELAKTNYAEYKRLKAEAKAKGIIA